MIFMEKVTEFIAALESDCSYETLQVVLMWILNDIQLFDLCLALFIGNLFQTFSNFDAAENDYYYHHQR